MKQEIKVSDLEEMLWLNGEGFTGYAITKTGEVWTSKISHKNLKGDWLQMKLYKDAKGYLRVGLRGKQESRNFFLHRLLAITFLPNPLNLPYINHKDGNKLNNSLDNLEWCTTQGNIQHAYNTGLKRPANTKSVVQIDPHSGKELATFTSITEAIKILNIKSGNRIAKCASNHPRCLTSGGYMWRYEKENLKLPKNINTYNKFLIYKWYIDNIKFQSQGNT
jgi:hypothetical protein